MVTARPNPIFEKPPSALMSSRRKRRKAAIKRSNPIEKSAFATRSRVWMALISREADPAMP